MSTKNTQRLFKNTKKIIKIVIVSNSYFYYVLIIILCPVGFSTSMPLLD